MRFSFLKSQVFIQHKLFEYHCVVYRRTYIYEVVCKLFSFFFYKYTIVETKDILFMKSDNVRFPTRYARHKNSIKWKIFCRPSLVLLYESFMAIKWWV